MSLKYQCQVEVRFQSSSAQTLYRKSINSEIPTLPSMLGSDKDKRKPQRRRISAQEKNTICTAECMRNRGRLGNQMCITQYNPICVQRHTDAAQNMLRVMQLKQPRAILHTAHKVLLQVRSHLGPSTAGATPALHDRKERQQR